jgi:hypothetical protein
LTINDAAANQDPASDETIIQPPECLDALFRITSAISSCKLQAAKLFSFGNMGFTFVVRRLTGTRAFPAERLLPSHVVITYLTTAGD